MMDSLVVTVIGPDRPGLVSLLSDRGKAHGASWEESRMASLAGQFAGIVHFQVPPAQTAALTRRCRNWKPWACAWSLPPARASRRKAPGVC